MEPKRVLTEEEKETLEKFKTGLTYKGRSENWEVMYGITGWLNEEDDFEDELELKLTYIGKDSVSNWVAYSVNNWNGYASGRRMFETNEDRSSLNKPWVGGAVKFWAFYLSDNNRPKNKLSKITFAYKK